MVKVYGSKIDPIQTLATMKVSTDTIKDVAKESLFGKMAMFMKGNSSMTNSMDLAE